MAEANNAAKSGAGPWPAAASQAAVGGLRARRSLRGCPTLAGARKRSGQALIEFALILPLVFLLIVNVVNLGAFLFAWITVVNASRGGGQYAAFGAGSAGSPAPPTGSQVNGLITQDISSLLNRASLSVNVCQNNNGIVTALRGTCTGIASDPEPATYVLTAVDVTYTYQPPIALFSFPRLGISATLPPTTIHRRTYMRVIR